MSLLSRRLLPLVPVIVSLLVASSSLAGVHEDYARDQYLKALANEVQAIKQGGAGKPEIVDRLNVAFYDAKERIQTMDKIKSLGQSVTESVRTYLKDTHLPALEAVYSQWQLTPNKGAYDKANEAARARLKVAEAELKAAYAEAKIHGPALKRMLQFLALARSETLADGTIGDWNPDSPEAIQQSALAGLRRVLEAMEQPDVESKPMTVDSLLRFQAILLGRAAHFYSQPGRINDIVFQQSDGQKVHVKKYLEAWERTVAERPAGLEAANEAYGTFLHLHPFGDANGRVAELARQFILSKADLPPLITREKTAVENYKYQGLFGGGIVADAHTGLATETTAFIKGLSKVIGENGRITGVDLAGGNVVAEVERAGKTSLVVVNRTYSLTEGTSLPPVTGSPVAVGKAPSEVSMRLTTDSWKTSTDLAPKEVVKTTREGPVNLSFAIYEVEVPSSAGGHKAQFAFYYDHPNGSRVWFNNNNRNFLALTAPAGACGELRRASGL